MKPWEDKQTRTIKLQTSQTQSSDSLSCYLLKEIVAHYVQVEGGHIGSMEGRSSGEKAWEKDGWCPRWKIGCLMHAGDLR